MTRQCSALLCMAVESALGLVAAQVNGFTAAMVEWGPGYGLLQSFIRPSVHALHCNALPTCSCVLTRHGWYTCMQAWGQSLRMRQAWMVHMQAGMGSFVADEAGMYDTHA